jgi:hypothetical protein
MTAVASLLLLAATGSTESGSKDAGESASAWHAGGFLFWMTLVVVLFVLLLLGAVLANRRGGGSAAPARAARDGTPPPRRIERVAPAAGWDLAVLGFDHIHGAERAYADVRRAAGDVPWLHDVAFAEGHRHGRVRIRGTFAGRYLDAEDLAAVPAEAPLLAELRSGVAEGASGLVAFAPADQVESLVDAFASSAPRVRRRTVTGPEAHALRAAVAEAPAATAGTGSPAADDAPPAVRAEHGAVTAREEPQ